MDHIEAFMKDVLGLEGQNSYEVREGVRRYMAEYAGSEMDDRLKFQLLPAP